MGGTLKPSLALPLNGVSGLRSTQRYQFQTETPLRTVAALSKFMAAGVLSCISPEIWAFQDALGGFCSLEKAL
mgnify:FL=1